METTSNRDDKGFRKLLVWQRAHELVLSVYKMAEKFPKSEMFSLTSQLKRAVVSILQISQKVRVQGQKPSLPVIWISPKARFQKWNIILCYQRTLDISARKNTMNSKRFEAKPAFSSIA